MDAATDILAGSGLRPSLQADYSTVRAFSETLALPLSPEDMTVQSMTDASPTKWHLAHTSRRSASLVAMVGHVAPQPAHVYTV